MATATAAAPTREDFAKLLDESMGTGNLQEGAVIKGKIVGIEKDMAVIDVGLKTEGRVALREFAAPGGLAANSRWNATRAARTSGKAEMIEAASPTFGVFSAASLRCARSSDLASIIAACRSSGLNPLSSTALATARYSNPLSRWRRP